MSDGDGGRSGSGLWLRVRRAFQGSLSGPGTDPSDVDGAVHPTKVLARVLDELSLQPAPVLLDLGPVIGANVSFLGERLACRLHLEDLFAAVDRLTGAGKDAEVRPMLDSALALDPASVHAVLAWDLFDHLMPEEAAVLAGRVVRVLRPGGLVMAIFATSHDARPLYRKYIIEDGEHLRHRWLPYSRPAQRVLLGRDVERLFSPLEVAESHLLTHHQRETLLRLPK
jgi:hypothetical protein